MSIPRRSNTNSINRRIILESLVLGRQLEGTRGEEIEAIVVPDYEYINNLGIETGKSFTSEEIEKSIKSEVHRLSSGLAEFKKVKYIQIREDEFEKTSTRKINDIYSPENPSLLTINPRKGRT